MTVHKMSIIACVRTHFGSFCFILCAEDATELLKVSGIHAVQVYCDSPSLSSAPSSMVPRQLLCASL